MSKVVEVEKLKIGEGIPKICVPIVGKTKEDIINYAKLIKESKADFVEWRADFFEHIMDESKVLQVLKSLKKLINPTPILFTIRTFNEGGKLNISNEEYLNINSKVISSNLISLIDIEFSMDKGIVESLIKESNKYNIYSIISKHDFEKTPNKCELIEIMRGMQALNGDILKIAVMPKDKSDVLTLLQGTEEMMRLYADRPIITISMGALGTISRLSGEFFGSSVTFGSVGEESAPGQILVNKLKRILMDLHEFQK